MTTCTCPSVEWRESRGGELYFVAADQSDGVWRFSDRSSWECRWYELKATAALIERASTLAATQPEAEAA
jgi:hypothetical protein